MTAHKPTESRHCTGCGVPGVLPSPRLAHARKSGALAKMTRQVFSGRRETAALISLALYLVAVLLAACLFVILPGTVQAQTAEPPSFPNVPASNPAHDAIVYLAGAKVISGFANGTLGPDQVLKRGQATMILVIWQGVPLAAASIGSSHFTDVDSTYQPYVDAAAAKGIFDYLGWSTTVYPAE